MTIRFDVTAESLTASRFISAGQSRFAVSAERLSTGLRLTSASADAAGAALSSKLQAQTLGWNRAQQNIQDGVSLAHVADTTFAKDDVPKAVILDVGSG